MKASGWPAAAEIYEAIRVKMRFMRRTLCVGCLPSNLHARRRFQPERTRRSTGMGKAALLWLIGVPIPVILVLWLLFH